MSLPRSKRPFFKTRSKTPAFYDDRRGFTKSTRLFDIGRLSTPNYQPKNNTHPGQKISDLSRPDENPPHLYLLSFKKDTLLFLLASFNLGDLISGSYIGALSFLISDPERTGQAELVRDGRSAYTLFTLFSFFPLICSSFLFLVSLLAKALGEASKLALVVCLSACLTERPDRWENGKNFIGACCRCCYYRCCCVSEVGGGSIVDLVS